MIRILKDCVLSGIPVHAGEIYPAANFREQDILIVLGLGFAARFTPPETSEEPTDAVPEDPEDFTVAPVLSAREASASADGTARSGGIDSPSAREAEPTSAVQAAPAARPASGQKRKKAKK